jgi:hypothetical protein
MISKDKTYRTRDGREVRIYATDGDDWSPIHGAIQTSGRWSACVWRKDGSRIDSTIEDLGDLIEVKPRIKRTVWLNVYEDDVHRFHTKQEAEDGSYKCRLACVKVEIDCEEGEGL